MNQTHVLKLARRTLKLGIAERSDKIILRLRFSAYGNFGDRRQVVQWLWPILKRFDSDPRPVLIEHPFSGETAVVCGLGDQTLRFVTSVPQGWL